MPSSPDHHHHHQQQHAAAAAMEELAAGSRRQQQDHHLHLQHQQQQPAFATAESAGASNRDVKPLTKEKSESSSAVIGRAQQEGSTTLGYGFEKPSAIQQRAVIPIISGRDVVAQAQSGIGKTSMVSLSAYQVTDTNVHK
ncbi:hypothetical protein ZWY2020_039850 [Hordeum vulgare]|nr:hypothetical protein ZWY2020_039850 [Hordeum vulgare]